MDTLKLEELRNKLKNNIISLSAECAEIHYTEEPFKKKLIETIKELEDLYENLEKLKNHHRGKS